MDTFIAPTPATKTRENCRGRGWKEYESQRTREFSVSLGLLEMSEKHNREIPQTWLPKHDLNKDGNNRHGNMKVEKHPRPLNLRQGSIGN